MDSLQCLDERHVQLLTPVRVSSLQNKISVCMCMFEMFEYIALATFQWLLEELPVHHIGNSSYLTVRSSETETIHHSSKLIENV